MAKILLVEDDRVSQLAVENCLEQNKHVTTCVPNYEEGFACIKLRTFDLIIVDWNLPDRSGIELTSAIRRQKIGTPILIITAKTDSDAIVTALDSGADDYISKPFEPRVLLAKTRALLRRGNFEEDRKLSVGGIVLDAQYLEVFIDGIKATVSPTECEILEKLMRNPNQAIPPSRLLQSSDPTTLRTFIKKLRRKLGDTDCKLIQSIKGIGYRFCTESATNSQG